MHGKDLLISCTLSFKNVDLRTFALGDTCTTGFAFVDKDFARLPSLPLQTLETACFIEVIDGSLINSGAVTHIAGLGLHINGHEVQAPFVVHSFGRYRVVRSIPWMELHDIASPFHSNSFTIDSDYYHHYCSSQPASLIIATTISIDLSPQPTGCKNQCPNDLRGGRETPIQNERSPSGHHHHRQVEPGHEGPYQQETMETANPHQVPRVYRTI